MLQDSSGINSLCPVPVSVWYLTSIDPGCFRYWYVRHQQQQQQHPHPHHPRHELQVRVASRMLPYVAYCNVHECYPYSTHAILHHSYTYRNLEGGGGGMGGRRHVWHHVWPVPGAWACNGDPGKSANKITAQEAGLRLVITLILFLASYSPFLVLPFVLGCFRGNVPCRVV